MRMRISTHPGAARIFIAMTALASMAVGTRLAAQTPSALGLGRLAPALDSTTHPRPNFRNRLVPAAIGGLAGAVTLGAAGYWIAGGCTRKCDVFTWDEVIVGGLAGAIAGSTWGAAIPPGRGLCTREQRIGMGLGGAFFGTIAAVALAQLPYTRPTVIITVPVASVMFMGGC